MFKSTRPITSSSVVTLKPIVALISKNTIVIVTITKRATENTPTSCTTVLSIEPVVNKPPSLPKRPTQIVPNKPQAP